MWTHLEPHSAKLEQVFEPLRVRAVQFDQMWSIAELRLPEDEVEWLRCWFGCLTPESTENWVKSVLLPKVEGEMFVTYRQMFGSLLICTGAEVCREESREDSVWPTIRSILPKSHAVRHELFLSNGQPTPLTKAAIADAARALNLRHALDIEGTQQWFVTIKLQFGFTRRGAKNRLAEWLVHLGRPHAVQYLDGESEFPELISTSFQSLWRALIQYRRDLINNTQVRDILQTNPWVKPHWVDDLMKEAKARVAMLGTKIVDAQPTSADTLSEEFCPFVNIALKWLPGETPRISFKLDRTAIEEQVTSENVTELDFYIDGNRLCRWLRQQDGSWGGTETIYAEPDNKRTQPNLRPRAFVVQTRSGEPLVEWDLSDSGLLEDVLVFDLQNETMLKAGFERLKPTRSYAIISDRDCEIQGCVSVETFERNGIARKVVRLGAPLNESLCVAYRDFVLWQPLQNQNNRRPDFELTLRTPETKILPLNDRTELLLEGLPEDAEPVELLIHKKTYEVRKSNGIWGTLKRITLTPELATRQRRVRVRFQSEGQTFSHIPRLTFNLVGAVMLRHGQTEEVTLATLKQDQDINLSERTASLWVWAPDGDNKARVLEGGYQAGRLRYGKIRLRDFAGHGGELQILSNVERYSLGIRCLDTGCIGGFLPRMLGNDAQLRLLAEKPPSDVGDNGYSLFEWIKKDAQKAKLVKLPHSCVQGSSTGRLWQLHYLSNPLAITLTWKGAWLGCWASLGNIRDYISQRRELTAQDFAIMKWLRVPVMHPTLCPTVRTAVLSTPCHFLKAWLNDEGLPDGLEPHGHILGLDSVIRHFLWNDFSPAHASEAITLAGRWENVYQEDQCVNLLTMLSDISPILLWKGMERCLENYTPKILELIHRFVHVRLGLLPNSSKQQLDYRLRGLAERTLRATGITEKNLDEILRERFESMMNKVWHPSDKDSADLLRLGETDSGRRYLSARMVRHWIDLTDA